MDVEKLNPRSRLFQLSLSNPGAGGLPADVLRLIRKMVKSGWNPRFDMFGATDRAESLQETNMVTPWDDARDLVFMIYPGIWPTFMPTSTIDKRPDAQFSISYMLKPGVFIDRTVYKHTFVALTGDFQGHVYVLATSATHIYITKQFLASPDECAPRRLTAVTPRKTYEQNECVYKIRACCCYIVLSAHAAASGTTVLRVFRLPDTAAHRNVTVRLDDYQLGKSVHFAGTQWRFVVDSMGTVIGRDFMGKRFLVDVRTSRVITRKFDNEPPPPPERRRRSDEHLTLWQSIFFWFFSAAIIAVLAFIKA